MLVTAVVRDYDMNQTERILTFHFIKRKENTKSCYNA